MAERRAFGWRDKRTGDRVSISSCPTRELAEKELEYWKRRDAKGKRPDLHELMPFIEVFEIPPEKWGVYP